MELHPTNRRRHRRQLKYAGYDADDLAFLESSFGRQAIIDLHIQGFIRYINHQIA